MSHKIGRFLSKSTFTKIFFVILSLISFFFPYINLIINMMDFIME